MSTSDKRNIVITAALPYANGSIHLGHMVEHTMVDFWTRFQKREATIAHLSVLMIHGADNDKRQEAGITPEQLIAKKKEHLQDFSAFGIAYDNYSSTNDEANKELADTIYTHLRDNGHIEQKEIEQYYCEHDKMFLPDRYVKGTVQNVTLKINMETAVRFAELYMMPQNYLIQNAPFARTFQFLKKLNMHF